MSFIPLDYKNFILSKVNNTISTSYIHSDDSTHLYSNYLDSKSLINLNSYSNLSFEECNLPDILSAGEKLSGRSKLKWFYGVINGFTNTDFANHDTGYAESYFASKSLLNAGSPPIYNDSIKEYNFRSKYSVDRIEQKFLPDSFELQKKNIVNNCLYKSYYENFSLDFYKNLKKGFCNYNSINFFSTQNDINVNHSNCLIWPNAKSSSGNTYNFINSSFAFSCFFNLRKNYSNEKQPECLVHIPDVISVYLVKGISNPEMHRIAITIGEASIKKIKETNSSFFDSSSRRINDDKDAYVSAELDIFNNHWYNSCFNVKLNDDNSVLLEIYIDGINKDTFTLTLDKAVNVPTHSFICIGNKPDYTSPVSNNLNTNFNKIFYQLFGTKLSNDKIISGPSVNKDISLGLYSPWEDQGEENIENILDAGEGIKFESLKTKSSESFHGEIHDIRIYKQNLDSEKILTNIKSTIHNVANEISSYDLDFYVPVFYLPVYSNKKSIVNSTTSKLNLYFSNLYNPYLSSFCGGLEVTAESYLVDFVNHSKPNIVIGGVDYKNTYDDMSSNNFNSLISSVDDVAYIKKGILSKSIYNKNLNNQSHTNIADSVDNNLSYRNLMILPNDNGIPSVKFSIIDDILPLLEHDSNAIADESFHVNTNNIFSDEEQYNIKFNYDRLFDEGSHTFSINLASEEKIERRSSSYNFEFTSDKGFNVSNIIYHDNRITDIQTLSAAYDVDDVLLSSLTSIRDNFVYTDSNPILRNYKQSHSEFKLDILSTLREEEVVSSNSNNESVSINRIFKKLPLPYSAINKDYDCLFSTIIDIPNKFYNNKINKNSFTIVDKNIITSNSNINISLSENGSGNIFRNNCLTKVAEWNYVGHIFYNEGIVSLNRPELSYFGETDFECSFNSNFSMFVNEINIPAESSMINHSSNDTYDEDLRHDTSSFNSEDSFVYITDINLHDENLNVVARAKLARPAPKKDSDNILFRLKMDY